MVCEGAGRSGIQKSAHFDAPIRRLERDVGREGGVGEMYGARLLQEFGEAVHKTGDDLLYEVSVFTGDREQREDLQAARCAGPYVGALQRKFGEFPLLQCFVAFTQVESGRVDVCGHVFEVQVEKLAGVPAAVGHVDGQFDGEEAGHGFA